MAHQIKTRHHDEAGSHTGSHTLSDSVIMSAHASPTEPFANWAKLRAVANQLRRERPETFTSVVGWLTLAEPYAQIPDFVNPPMEAGESRDSYLARCRGERHAYEMANDAAFHEKDEFAKEALRMLTTAMRQSTEQAVTSTASEDDFPIASLYHSFLVSIRGGVVFPRKDEPISPIEPPSMFVQHC